MVTKLVIELELRLYFRRKIFEVVVKSHDGAIVQVIARAGIGIEPVIHYNRFKPFEGPLGDVVLP